MRRLLATSLLSGSILISAVGTMLPACGSNVDGASAFTGATGAQTSSSDATGSTSSTSTGSGTGGAGGSTSTSATGTSATTGTSASTGGVDDNCAEVCATEATLMCPNSTLANCTEGCEAALDSVTWCTPTVAALVDCFSKSPASDFMCDANGKTATKDGLCKSETTAAETCWFDGPPGGLPDLTQACADACAKESALPCANPMCKQSCATVVMKGVKCAGAYAALIACAAKQDAGSYTCDMSMPPKVTLNPGHCDFETSIVASCLAAP